MPEISCRTRVLECLNQFLRSLGRSVPKITDETHLINDLNLSSDEGIDFVLDLCEVFKFEFPDDFNPIIHQSGKRGLCFGEMVERIAAFVSTQEAVK